MKQRCSLSRAVRLGMVAAACCLATVSAWADDGTRVRLVTPAGPIDVALLDAEAPLTVANFLNYVRRGDYTGSFFHRLVPGFVLQGGGFRWDDTTVPKLSRVPTDAPVRNEFNAERPNVRGTVAMAKVAGNPDSATSQWFVNLADNRTNLDNQNGGFTVFGRLTPPSMATAERVAALQVVNASGCTGTLGTASSALGDLPVRSRPATCGSIAATHLVVVGEVHEWSRRAGGSDAERIFDYLEAAYPEYASPPNSPTLEWEGYTYRYYATTGAYVGTRGGQLYYLIPSLGQDITPLGSDKYWLGVAAANGY